MVQKRAPLLKGHQEVQVAVFSGFPRATEPKTRTLTAPWRAQRLSTASLLALRVSRSMPLFFHGPRGVAGNEVLLEPVEEEEDG